MTNGSEAPRAGVRRDAISRWECRCQQPPVLLATYDAHGRIHIKVRDRYWHVDGQVRAICHRCGTEHVLDLRGSATGTGSGRPPTARRETG